MFHWFGSQIYLLQSAQGYGINLSQCINTICNISPSDMHYRSYTVEVSQAVSILVMDNTVVPSCQLSRISLNFISVLYRFSIMSYKYEIIICIFWNLIFKIVANHAYMHISCNALHVTQEYFNFLMCIGQEASGYVLLFPRSTLDDPLCCPLPTTLYPYNQIPRFLSPFHIN